MRDLRERAGKEIVTFFYGRRQQHPSLPPVFITLAHIHAHAQARFLTFFHVKLSVCYYLLSSKSWSGLVSSLSHQIIKIIQCHLLTSKQHNKIHKHYIQLYITIIYSHACTRKKSQFYYELKT